MSSIINCYNMKQSFLHNHDSKFMELVISHYEIEANNILSTSSAAREKQRAITLAYFYAIPNNNISDRIIYETREFINVTRDRLILLEEAQNNLKEQYKQYEYANSTIKLLISEGLNVDDIKIDREFILCEKTIDTIQEEIDNLNSFINLSETDILEYLSDLWLRENPDRKY